MCVIVDVNVFHKVFFQEDAGVLSALRRSILGERHPHARMVYGGRLRREYLESTKIRRFLVTLDQAGRLSSVPDDLVDREEEVVKSLGLCLSDDEHIIALARAGSIGVLCSDDTALQRDFKNRQLLASPRGKIYKNETHDRLLEEHCRDH